jgi:type I restriction enzyme R subunit
MSQLPNERTAVELPFVAQLKSMGWSHVEGDIHVPYMTDRQSFREVLLGKRLREAIRKINLDEHGKEWLDDARISQAVSAMERLGALKLMEANEAATELLLKGVPVDGPDGGRDVMVKFIEFDNWKQNDFLAISQFRVDRPGTANFIQPDIVLFVNGIPLVVVECKNPAATGPMEKAISDLLAYSNQREWVDGEEGVEKLFHYNQLMVGTYFNEARVGTVGCEPTHFLEWKDTSPVATADAAKELGKTKLSSQETLVAGMLRPELLLDIVRNFTLFTQVQSKTIKIVARYQQFRAVHAALRRLKTGKTRAQHGEHDQRGGIVWHTQGSGKSLTMVFLIRRMRVDPAMRKFKIVVVTDRTDLERQLSATAALTGETVLRARNAKRLQAMLKEQGPGLVFAMVQKYQERDDAGTGAGEGIDLDAADTFPLLNDSEDVLVMVDEAHRSHTKSFHANMQQALPNAARIGFTGTPILKAKKKATTDIFGGFIDRYTIRQSEADGSTVPILYEGRMADVTLPDGKRLDQLFEELFPDLDKDDIEKVQQKHASKRHVLEAAEVIGAKARDMLKHYVTTVLPNGFKAQVVASSRLAAIRYQAALEAARKELVEAIESGDGSDAEYVATAKPLMPLIRSLEFGVVISGGGKDDPLGPSAAEWTDESKNEARIERFKKPLRHKDPAKQDALAFLCVKSMLLTGFDAPVEQVLYLDRFMQGHELLQAIARVNRTAGPEKQCGYVVDYCGIGKRLSEALSVYDDEDVDGAIQSIKNEVPKLKDRHREVCEVFHERGVHDLGDAEECVELLRDERIRAEFAVKLKRFLDTLEVVLPRPEALPYVANAKRLGFIRKSAANLYRDSSLNLIGAGRKVRDLIDEHVRASGVEPTVAPVSIMAADFEKAVDGRGSDRTKASEMEHAARHHISAHFDEDPAHYQKLSERLEEILRTFKDNWADLVKALKGFVGEVRGGRQADDTGLDPRTQAPFFGLLADAVQADSGKEPAPEERTRLAAFTVEMVEHLRQEVRVVDFWRNAHAQETTRKWVVRFLDAHDVVSFDRQRAVADRILELAKTLHTRLCE